MGSLISEKTVTARKDHDCMACDWVLAEGINGFGFSRPDLRILAKARANKWKIKRGDEYLRQALIDVGGLIYTFKAIPEVHQICLDYDLYNE